MRTEMSIRMEADMKSDARTRYTEKVIRDSFLSLLKEKHYSRITVK